MYGPRLGVPIHRIMWGNVVMKWNRWFDRLAGLFCLVVGFWIYALADIPIQYTAVGFGCFIYGAGINMLLADYQPKEKESDKPFRVAFPMQLKREAIAVILLTPLLLVFPGIDYSLWFILGLSFGLCMK